MKQRVELARALAASPDVLFMDEPFGALDYLTRLSLRAELLEIWDRERVTIMFVTHDLEEAVQLADRVVILSPRPGMIRCIVPVELPRPRLLDSPEYLRLLNEVFDCMGIAPTGGESAMPERHAPNLA
jgi:NitT/TauT family transport system ATP-binding protein